jgi:hypothetical protein
MSEKNVKVQTGWFAFWHHDLYAGVWYIGPFLSKSEAEESSSDWKGADYIYVKEYPFVRYGGQITALCEETNVDLDF